MNIRAITAADAEIFQTLRLEALQINPEAFGSSYESEHTLSLDDVRERLGRSTTGDNCILLAFDDEVAVGMIGLLRETYLKSRHKAIIWGMYVSPSHRGRKVGAALLEDCIQRAHHVDDLEQISLTVISSNVAAIRLYLSYGFEQYGHERRAFKHHSQYFDAVYMALFLEPTAD